MAEVLDEKKFAIIFIKRDGENHERMMQEISKLAVPEGCYADVIVIEDAGNLAEAYNFAMQQSDAKYKLYFKRDIVSLSSNLLELVENLFLQALSAGILGLWGSELPMDGNYIKSRNQYGACLHQDENGEIQCSSAQDPLFYQEVKALDGAFLATCVDVPWDEQIGDDFLALAQCCRMARSGYSAIVPMQGWGQGKGWMVFSTPNDYMNSGGAQSKDERKFHAERQNFLKIYRKDVLPLVSILIPTYNQPEFFRQALESALAQDYGNIEIVVGDDSTDDRTKELIQPYLREHPEIRYYHHGGPLGGLGKLNANFVLEQSRGEYVNYLLHDDLFYPGKIRRMMECYIQDLNGEIGFVTSMRHEIDTEGHIRGIYNIWYPNREQVEFSGYDVGRKLLLGGYNFIGETTTVLLPKKLLFVPELGTYRNGCYFGMEDSSMGDVSTWLELGRHGKRCVCFQEGLSAFRVYPGQNSHEPSIRVKVYTEWMKLLVLSWLQGVYIRSEEECLQLCWRYCDFMKRELMPQLEETDDTLKEQREICRALIRAREAGENQKMFHLIVEDILVHAICPEHVMALCTKDTDTGLWRKK